MRLYFLIFFTIAFLSCTAQRPLPTFAITNVNIIDPVRERILPNKTVLLKDSVILNIVDTSEIPEGLPDSLILDGSGRYLISGFWNMHTHVCWIEGLNERLFPILLSYGITGVRDMGGDLKLTRQFKKLTQQNPTSGPIIYGPGPLIDGASPIHPDFSVSLTEENFQEVMDSLYHNGADFFKVYSLLPEALVEKVSRYAAEKGVPFAGHISEYIAPEKAARLHQKSFEHLNRIDALLEDTVALTTFISTVKENGNWLCPTLVIYERKVQMSAGLDLYHPIFDKLPPLLQAEWQYAGRWREKQGSLQEEHQSLLIRQQQLVQYLYQEELPMLIGSDFGGMAYIYPGLGLHREMQLLSEIGFDNYDILKMATYHPALYFGIEELHGTIEPGKLANLVLLDGNPVEEIKNTQDINVVFRNGKPVP